MVSEHRSFDDWSSEQLILCRDEALGLRAAIAIDDTTLGNGFGGVRFKNYATTAEGILEARRLARAMTYKNAAAGLDYGGAKSVLYAGDKIVDRAAFMRRYGEFIARMGAAYMPGVDMGTTTDDLKWMAEGGADVLWVDDDPSPSTAAGVLHAIRAAVVFVRGAESLEGVHVLIQGVGHVGESLARHLAAAGARLSLMDLDRERVLQLAGELGGRSIVDGDVTDVECDVFAPCAVARVINAHSVGRLKCGIVAGAANDTLADDALAGELAARSITYVPDFLANAGGVIDIDARHRRFTSEQRDDALELIGERVAYVLEDARRRAVSTVEAAQQYAWQRISAARADNVAAR